MDDTAGPTAERLSHANGNYHRSGRSKSERRYSMYDDALGRAWTHRKITDEEYWALRRYAHHWASGGLSGALCSLDLDRIKSTVPGYSDRQAEHRATYYAGRAAIGARPALVADGVACVGLSLAEAGLMLGYHSLAHARTTAGEILAEAGYRLSRFWKDR